MWRFKDLAASSPAGTYLKTFDLRKDGRVDPLVDDIATVELDLWANEQGMSKMQHNVFGL